MIKNVIIPNIHYDCDYFVHFYNVTYEPPSRSGKGGPIMPEDVYLLREAVHRIAMRAGRQLPHVGFTLDTEAKFERKHAVLLRKIRNEDGRNPFHGNEQTYTVETYVNIIKMWYSISSVWEFMREHASFQNIRYDRVAMMRSDVVYLTQIDIFQSAPDGIFDRFNNQSVIPGFAGFPVNDRMFYGPYEAAEIWATGRFSRLDDYIYKMHRPLHSEQFLAAKILPAIRARSISVGVDPGICFWRARADRSVWNDCGGLDSQGLLENLFNRSCSSQATPLMIIAFQCFLQSSILTTSISPTSSTRSSVTQAKIPTESAKKSSVAKATSSSIDNAGNRTLIRNIVSKNTFAKKAQVEVKL